MSIYPKVAFKPRTNTIICQHHTFEGLWPWVKLGSTYVILADVNDAWKYLILVSWVDLRCKQIPGRYLMLLQSERWHFLHIYNELWPLHVAFIIVAMDHQFQAPTAQLEEKCCKWYSEEATTGSKSTAVCSLSSLPRGCIHQWTGILWVDLGFLPLFPQMIWWFSMVMRLMPKGRFRQCPSRVEKRHFSGSNYVERRSLWAEKSKLK